MLRSVESLGHRQREMTYEPFARYLVDQVRARLGTYLVAALWVRKDSVYWGMPGVECWDEARDAYNYPGPYPVICHPPCGPHGRYHHVSKQDALAGHLALLYADKYGGVVEQPASSSLFRGGEYVRQCDYGHPAIKATRLYWPSWVLNYLSTELSTTSQP